MAMSEREREDKEGPRRKELEAMLKQMKDEYIRKMGAHTSLSAMNRVNTHICPSL